jgi:signal recognition particle GTPase
VSKKEQTVKEETAKVVEEMSDGKTTEELQSIAQTLQTQLQHHQTMAVKAQGALEVILQMIPGNENDNDNNGGESNNK